MKTHGKDGERAAVASATIESTVANATRKINDRDRGFSPTATFNRRYAAKMNMRYSNSHNRRTYWTVQMLLMAPVILMWCGVAYWFGFASEVILKLAFPPMLAPVSFSLLLLTALAWTLWHRSRVPRWCRDVRRTDTAICVFIAFSMLLVIGQIMGM